MAHINSPVSHAGHRKRLKERFLAHHGADFTDAQYLELLLFYAIPQGDTTPTSRRLLDRFGSLSGVLSATIEELCEVDGIGAHAAFLLHLLPNLHRRSVEGSMSEEYHIQSIRDAELFLAPLFQNAQQELCYLLSLDGCGNVLNCTLVSSGNGRSVLLNQRSIAECALRCRAVGVILAHCHPLGRAEPSAADQLTTQSCKKMLHLLEVELLDHLIFARDECCSMRQAGYL